MPLTRSPIVPSKYTTHSSTLQQLTENLKIGQGTNPDVPTSPSNRLPKQPHRLQGLGKRMCKVWLRTISKSSPRNTDPTTRRSVFIIPTATTIFSYATKLSTITLTRAQYDVAYSSEMRTYTTAYATTITSKKRNC